MRLLPLEASDIGVCVNYIVEEYEKYSSGSTRGLSDRMAYAIEDKLGWKVEKDNMIIGFALVEEFGNSLLVTSLVVNDKHRTGKATWLIFREILREADGRKLLYIPMHKDMWASKLCKDGAIDSVKAKEWVDKLASRWE